MHITSKIMKRIFGSILDQARQERGICKAKTHPSKSCHSAGETSANGEPRARLQVSGVSCLMETMMLLNISYHFKTDHIKGSQINICQPQES